MNNNLEPIKDCLGYQFSDIKLLQNALSHGAFHGLNSGEFQRLEFLGDRVFNLSLADILYKNFPNENEGKLAVRQSYFSSASFMSKVASEHNLVQYLNIPLDDSGEKCLSAIADSVESIIGAVYLDGGYQSAYNIVRNWVSNYLSTPISKLKDAKSSLQEWSQSKGLGIPKYTVLSRIGSDHEPTFAVNVCILDTKFSAMGEGRSIKTAEMNAAQTLLDEVQSK